MTTTTKILISVLAVAGILAAASSAYNWYAPQFQPATSRTEYVRVPEIRTVTKIKKVYVPGSKEIVTFEKEKIVEKLKLPNWVAADADEQVIATAEIPPYEGTTNAVALLNTRTGVGNIIAKQQPISLFAFENKKEIGVRAGYTTDQFKQLITAFGRWQFFRVGNMHLGVYGEGNSSGEAIGQVEVNYRF